MKTNCLLFVFCAILLSSILFGGCSSDNDDVLNNNVIFDEFTLLQTGDVYYLTTNEAKVSCTFSSQLLDSKPTFGIYYNINKQELENYNGEKVTVGAVDGTKYDVTLFGLSRGTTYYYRAYARIGDLTYMGNIKSFTTVLNSVTNIEISPDTLSLCITETAMLEVSVHPEDASVKDYTYSNSNPDVATVSKDGKVQPLSIGNTLITATTMDGGHTATCAVTVTPVYVNSLSLDHDTIALVPESKTTLEAIIVPDNAYNKNVTWTSSNTTVAQVNDGVVEALAIGNAKITATAQDGSGYSATCDVIVTTLQTDSAVDMGLSVKWANFNIGASSPEEYGGYYAFGETSEKNEYSWDTYLVNHVSAGDYKFDKLDPYYYVGIAKSKYDVAHVLWGGSWYMPEVDQCEELISNCTWTWSSYKDVNGCFVLGPNNHMIFLPAGGWKWSKSYYFNESGRYWSSSFADPHSGCILNFNSAVYRTWSTERPNGLLVRPVMDY